MKYTGRCENDVDVRVRRADLSAPAASRSLITGVWPLQAATWGPQGPAVRGVRTQLALWKVRTAISSGSGEATKGSRTVLDKGSSLPLDPPACGALAGHHQRRDAEDAAVDVGVRVREQVLDLSRYP